MDLKRMLFLLLAFLPMIIFADKFKVDEFKAVPNDLTLRKDAVTDVNDKYCALIKLRTEITGLDFRASIHGVCDEVKYQRGEYWIYISPKEERLEIFKEGFEKLNYDLPMKIESSMVYEMVVSRIYSDPNEAAKNLGLINIKSYPEGADVWINGKATGSLTPFTKKLQSGYYNYTLKKGMYEDHDSGFIVQANVTTFVKDTLAPKFGSMFVASVPEQGAEIMIDGITQDQKTPAEINFLPVGKHKLVLRKEMFEPYETEFEIKAGVRHEEYTSLNPTFGVVNITTDHDAVIYIDEDSVGTGQYSGKLLFGFYKLEAKRKKNYDFKHIEVKAGGIYNLTLLTKPTMGSIEIYSTPDEANVYINGIFIDKTPYMNHEMEIGKHIIKLEKEGYLDLVDTIEIKMNQKNILDKMLSRISLPQPEEIVYTELGNTGECKGTFTDHRDGQIYKMVEINDQCWMAQNLNYKTSRYSYCYNEDPVKCNKYGRLYEWEMALTACPDGWHLPSKEEWDAMIEFAGGKSDAGEKLKIGTGWKYSGSGTDEFEFATIPGGYMHRGCDYRNIGFNAYFWTSTKKKNKYPYVKKLSYNDDKVSEYDRAYKDFGRSVRCIKNK